MSLWMPSSASSRATPLQSLLPRCGRLLRPPCAPSCARTGWEEASASNSLIWPCSGCSQGTTPRSFPPANPTRPVRRVPQKAGLRRLLRNNHLPPQHTPTPRRPCQAGDKVTERRGARGGSEGKRPSLSLIPPEMRASRPRKVPRRPRSRVRETCTTPRRGSCSRSGRTRRGSASVLAPARRGPPSRTSQGKSPFSGALGPPNQAPVMACKLVVFLACLLPLPHRCSIGRGRARER